MLAGVERLRGTVNYLSRFVPKLTDVMRPISDLTRPDVEWSWTSSHDKAFEEVKHLLTVAPVLAYFDPSKELSIQFDASGQGLGAALLQEGRPLPYASRALSDTETRCDHRKEDAGDRFCPREMAPVHFWATSHSIF